MGAPAEAEGVKAFVGLRGRMELVAGRAGAWVRETSGLQT